MLMLSDESRHCFTLKIKHLDFLWVAKLWRSATQCLFVRFYKMFDCAFKTQLIGGQREKFVRYGCSLIKIISYLWLCVILFCCEYCFVPFVIVENEGEWEHFHLMHISTIVTYEEHYTFHLNEGQCKLFNHAFKFYSVPWKQGC